jgi:gamma-glutamyltranspeptidase
MAEQLSKEIQEAGGIVTKGDIESYIPILRSPVQLSVFGFDYIGAPPPSSGGAALATILSFFTGYDVPLVRQGGLYTHRLAEAMKHAFGLRMSLNDPDFASEMNKAAFAAMTNTTYISDLRRVAQKCHNLTQKCHNLTQNCNPKKKKMF